jgi:hypothetical protein
VTYIKNIWLLALPPSLNDADKQQWRYLYPVRIRVTDSIAIPSVTRSVGGFAELIINTDLSFEDIRTFVGDHLTESEIAEFYLLWADDEADRKFIPIEGSTDFYIEKR